MLMAPISVALVAVRFSFICDSFDRCIHAVRGALVRIDPRARGTTPFLWAKRINAEKTVYAECVNQTAHRRVPVIPTVSAQLSQHEHESSTDRSPRCEVGGSCVRSSSSNRRRCLDRVA